MIAVTSLLVAVFIASGNAYVQSEYCTQETIGSIDGLPVPLTQVSLYPGQADWEIQIPSVPQCPYGAAGVKAIVCDTDQRPSIRFINLKQLLVHRIGSLQDAGRVQIIVYCHNGYNQPHATLSNDLSPTLNALPSGLPNSLNVLTSSLSSPSVNALPVPSPVISSGVYGSLPTLTALPTVKYNGYY